MVSANNAGKVSDYSFALFFMISNNLCVSSGFVMSSASGNNKFQIHKNIEIYSVKEHTMLCSPIKIFPLYSATLPPVSSKTITLDL